MNDEFFRSVRFAHRLVMTVSTALLLFAFSPDPTARYRAAKDELTALQNAQFGDFAAHVVNDAALGSALSTPSCFDDGFDDSKLEATMRARFDLPSVSVRRHMLLVPVPDRETSTVSTYFRFLNEASLLEFCVTPQVIADRVIAADQQNGAAFADIRRAGAAEIEILFADDSFNAAPVSDVAMYTISFADLRRLGHGDGSAVLEFWPLAEFFDSNAELFQLAVRPVGGEAFGYPIIGLSEGVTPSETPLTPISWFSDADGPDSSALAMPALFTLMDEVGARSLDNAVRHVDREIELRTRNPQIYGVEIDADLASVVAPGVLLTLFGFLVITLHMLLAELERRDSVALFPSMMFYEGRGRSGAAILGVAIVSMTVFPVGATTLFVHRIVDWTTPLAVVSAVLLLCCLAAAIAATRLVWRSRMAIRSKGEALPAA